MKVLTFGSLAALLAAFAPAALAQTGEPTALSKEQQGIFRGSPADPMPPELHKGHHYYAGNEDHLDLFTQDIKDLGGGYIGVGSDQAYLFIGWQKPDFAWFTDYDAAVEESHLIHQPLILAADTPAAFIDSWGEENAANVQALLVKTYTGTELARVQKTYKHGRKPIHARLRKLKKLLDSRSAKGWLNDQAQYTWVRAFVRAGRARPMLGNLLDKNALIGIGDAARKLGVTIRVFYPSNAEQYWDYDEQYRKNITGLPFDDKSMVIRTISKKGNDYTYNIQKAQNYVGWLARKNIKNIRFIPRRFVTRDELIRFSVADQDPTPKPKKGARSKQGDTTAAKNTP